MARRDSRRHYGGDATADKLAACTQRPRQRGSVLRSIARYVLRIDTVQKLRRIDPYGN